jgi:hypothetical protein
MKGIQKGQFACKILVIHQTALLQASSILHTKLHCRIAIKFSIAQAISVNMSALLTDCIIVEQHTVIQFLWSEGVKPFKTHRRLSAQYRKNVVCKGRVLMNGKVPKWQNKHHQ